MIYVVVVYMKEDQVVKTLTRAHHSMHSCDSFIRVARHSASVAARRASLDARRGVEGCVHRVGAGGEEFVVRRVSFCVCLCSEEKSLRVTNRRLATRGGRGKTRGGRGGGRGRCVRSGRRARDRWVVGRGREARRRARGRRRRREDEDETRGRRRARIEEGSMKGG